MWQKSIEGFNVLVIKINIKLQMNNLGMYQYNESPLQIRGQHASIIDLIMNMI